MRERERERERESGLGAVKGIQPYHMKVHVVSIKHKHSIGF